MLPPYLKKSLSFLYFFLCFAIVFILLGILCVYHYFPDASFNQLFFHAQYLDWQQLNSWHSVILTIVLISALAAWIIHKWLPALLFPLILLMCVLHHPLKTSNIEVNKPSSLWKQLQLSLQWSNIYERYYVTPQIHTPKSPKNIIFIFAESIEDNFADEKYWGENLIPNLSKLKEEGTSFAGYESINGTNWTLASNVSTFCGVPIRVHLRDFLGTETEQFLPNTKCLPDILKSVGYYNVFSTSTYIHFVGTDIFVGEHSFNEIYGRDEMLFEDYASAEDIGIKEFGINDKKMFEFARQKITDLAKNNAPFFISIQTLDTHFPSGYVHPSCSITYGDTRDAIKCLDKTIYDFVRWVQEQEFYNDTIIIIAGDHLMMTATDIADLTEAYPNRQIYNVILAKDTAPKIIKKPYSMMDWGATVADKAGVLSNKRLGLGVSLLGNEKTLTEKLGMRKFEEELLKNSAMYDHFLNRNHKSQKSLSDDTLKDFKLSKSRTIAHACGSIDGHVYTNSLEALNASALRGYKYIEIDLLPLIDEQHGFFAAHDYKEFKALVSGTQKFDRKTINSLKILGKYTPLTDDTILAFFEEHPEIWLVTDKITDFALLNQKFGKIKDRIIAEFWDNEQYNEAQKYGFKNLAYSLNTIDDIPLVLSAGYKLVTVSLEFLQKNKNVLQQLRQKKGIKVMVYTLKNKAEVLKYDDSVDMIYYDGEESITTE